MKDNKKVTGLRKLGVILLSIGVFLFAVALVLRIFRLGDWSMWSILGIIPAVMGAIFFVGGKGKPITETRELDDSEKEKLDKVIDYVKWKKSVLSYHIEEITKEEPISLTDSKFGGYPYWTKDKEYPVNSEGEKMFLLAQINFEQMAPEDDLLPKSGILQFFTEDDELCGMDYDAPTEQKGFRVIYHSEIGEPLSIEELRALGIPANTDYTSYKETMLPSYAEDAIKFTKTVDYVSNASDEFEEYVKEAMFELYGRKLEDTLWREIDEAEYDYISEPFSTFGHKMLGMPAFTQNDPRFKKGAKFPEHRKANTIEHYNILLFQMDSQGHVIWGDDGVANFFINSEDLKNLDFSDVLYNWDCY